MSESEASCSGGSNSEAAKVHFTFVLKAPNVYEICSSLDMKNDP